MAWTEAIAVNMLRSLILDMFIIRASKCCYGKKKIKFQLYPLVSSCSEVIYLPVKSMSTIFLVSYLIVPCGSLAQISRYYCCIE